MSPDWPTCQEVVDLVTEYLEGALDDERRARLEDHLASCEACSTHLAQMRDTIAATGRLREEDVPDEVMNLLTRSFRDVVGGRGDDT